MAAPGHQNQGQSPQRAKESRLPVPEPAPTADQKQRFVTQKSSPEKPSQTASRPNLVQYLKSVPLSGLPKELHAQSAIQITSSGSLQSLLNAEEQTFSFPLNQNDKVQLATTKIVRKKNERVILFGHLANGERSHSMLVFDDGNLTSGTLSFFDNEEEYRITSLTNNQTILSLTDPTIEVPSCGCEDCLANQR